MEKKLREKIIEKAHTSRNKVLKSVELVSLISSSLEDIEEGKLIHITPFAKSITLANESSPHVDTVKGKLAEAALWKSVTPNIKFHIKNNEITAIEKVSENNNSDQLLKSIFEKLDLILKEINQKS